MFISVIKTVLIIILVVLLVILLFAGYFLIAKTSYAIKANFDIKDFSLSLYDPLRLYKVALIYKDKADFKIALLFGLIKINPKNQTKKDKYANDKKKKNTKQDAKKGSARERIFALTTADNKKAVFFILNKVFKFLKGLKPKRIEAAIDFGFTTPDITGYITGLMATVPLFYEKKVKVYPDFSSDKSYINGNMLMSGGIRLIGVVKLFFEIFANKYCRNFVRQILHK